MGKKSLFSIVCTTCQARLSVRDTSAIGAILTCPKCESMVLVEAPEGWKAPPEESPAATPESISKPPIPEVPATPLDKESVAAPPVATAQSVFANPPADPAVQAAPAAGLGWLPIAAVAVVLVGGVAIWGAFHRRSVRPSAEPAVIEPADESPTTPALVQAPPPVSPRERWLPAETKIWLQLLPSRAAAVPEVYALGASLDPVWRALVESPLQGLGLKGEVVRRLTCAGTNLAAWPGSAVLLVELEPNQDATRLAETGESADLAALGTPCRRRPGSAWPHPFAVLDRHTILTGAPELLRSLSEQSSGGVSSKPLGQLLKVGEGNSFAAMRIDLTAARSAGWRMPDGWLAVWPDLHRPWKSMWENADAAALAIEIEPQLAGQLTFTAGATGATQRIRAAMEELLPLARKSSAALVELVPEKLRAGRIRAEEADAYDLLLRQGRAALESVKLESNGSLVTLRSQIALEGRLLAKAARAGAAVFGQDWDAAARNVDQGRYEGLAAALGGFQKAEGRYPAGAVGGALLPPDTRLSWLATLLPYFGHADWHRQLEFGYAWNGQQNRAVSQRALDNVVNPGLGPSLAEGGFPVTHYVGVAGVGPDAGRLAPDDPRAGVFGYGRATRPNEIADGASNTIAVLGVSGRLGPWAAGGNATVRPLTTAPYVNGPDGFGSGQSDGMFAAMADGSVRFISKDIDPKVLERLATIRGRETVSVANLLPAAGKLNLAAAPERPPEREKPAPKPAAELESTAAAKPVTPIIVDPRKTEAALATSIPEMALRDARLIDAVRLTGELAGGLPVTIDAEDLVRAGISPQDRMNVQVRATTVRGALVRTAELRGLALVVDNGHAVLSVPAEQRQSLVARLYRVEDLTSSKAAESQWLAKQICELVAPETWRAVGGSGAIKTTAPGLLSIEQTPLVHAQIVTFCEKLRTARKLSLRSGNEPQQYALTTRLDQSAARLSKAITLNFHEPAPLTAVLGAMEEASGVLMVPDWIALAQAGIGPATPVSLVIHGEPMSAVMEKLLRARGLGYRMVAADVMQLTSWKNVLATLDLEYLPVGDLLPASGSAAELIERIKTEVARSTWNDAGGPAQISFDGPSRCLLVLQSQPAQGAISRLLKQLRTERQAR